MENFKLSEKQKNILLEVARQTISNTIIGTAVPDFDINDPALNAGYGAFVTIHRMGKLRGCIGNIVSNIPLWKTVRNMAIEATIHDPRFSPVSADELKDIDIEISVLSPFKKIKDTSQVRVGEHGILIRKGFHQGLLLPQVASEYNWNREEFLEHTCYKAGLPKNCYRDPDCEISIFSALVFGEKE